MAAASVAVALAAPRVARAEPLSFACGPGLVLDVDAREADAIVTAVCAAARERLPRGQLRVGVVGDGAGGARVTVARALDSSGAEQVARGDVASADDASRRAAAIVDALVSPPSTTSPASPPPASPPPASAATASPLPASPLPATAPPADEARPWPAKKPRRTFFPIGVVGVIAAPQSTLTAGDTPVLFGGGGAVGVEHDRVLTYAELVFSGGASSKVESRQTAFVLAARGALTATKVAPLLGGGFLLTSTHTELRDAVRSSSDDGGLDLFGEAGAALKLDDANRLVLLGRLTPLASSKKPTLDVGYLYAF